MRRTWVLSVVMAGLAVAGAACGGGGGGDGVATAGGTTPIKAASASKSDPQQAGLDFARCMREHGVDMPDPTPGQPGSFSVKVDAGGGGGGGGGGTGGAVFGSGSMAFSANGSGDVVTADSEAFEACKHILDDAIDSRGDVAPDPQMQDRALKFAQCMRDHGVDMPDPTFSGGGVRVEIKGSMDPNSPTMQAAQEACNQYFGPPGGAKPGAMVTSSAGTKS